MCSRDDDPSTYDRVLEEASPDELHAAIRLLHVAGASQRRVLGAWRTEERCLEAPFPKLLAGVCLSIHDELVNRGLTLGLCPACLATVGSPNAAPPAAELSEAAP